MSFIRKTSQFLSQIFHKNISKEDKDNKFMSIVYVHYHCDEQNQNEVSCVKLTSLTEMLINRLGKNGFEHHLI